MSDYKNLYLKSDFIQWVESEIKNMDVPFSQFTRAALRVLVAASKKDISEKKLLKMIEMSE